MSLKIKILGCGSALPTTVRNASSQIVEHNTKPYLVDCCEGSQLLMRHCGVKFSLLDRIFISHLHGDHFFGIFGLLSTFSLLGRKGKVFIHCPKRLQEILESDFSPLNLKDLGFEVCFLPLEKGGKKLIFENKKLEVYSFELCHRVPVWGFLFQEKNAQRNIMKSCIEKYSLSISQIVDIKNGSDLVLPDGTVVSNKDLTLDPPHAASYAYVTDTIKLDSTAKNVCGVDVLYHEATYDSSLEERAAQTFHSTTFQAALTAKASGVKKLVLGHFSSRYTTTELLENEAKTIFENSVCAFDGMEFLI